MIRSAGGASHYYESSDDYYAKEGLRGQWEGKGASSLGLKGGVDPDTFKNLLDGQLPDGRQVRHSKTHDSRDRKGIDFTFSAPKSVSIQALVHGDKEVIAAHEKAVRDAIGRLEEFAMARTKHLGESRREATGNLVVATFRHELSRAQDPQLHTHCVTMNLTQRADGAWRGISNEEMLRNVKLVGAYYRAELATRLQSAGYELRETPKGGWELEGISDETIRHFSQRSAAVERYLAEQGQTRETADAVTKQLASLSSRPKKTDADRAWLKKHWHESAAAAGFKLEPSPRAAAVPGRTALDAARERRVARESVQSSIAHVSERQSVFTGRDLLVHAYAFGGTRTRPELLERELLNSTRELISDQFRHAPTGNATGRGAEAGARSPAPRVSLRRSYTSTSSRQAESSFVSVPPRIDAPATRPGIAVLSHRFATPRALANELEILRMSRDGAGSVSPLLGSQDVDALLRRGGLGTDQAASARLILTSPDRFVGIQGFAGTGKSHMLSQVIASVREDRHSRIQLIGLAPYGSQNRSLAELGLESRTLTSFLVQVKEQERVGPNTVIFLDEAGVVPTHQMKDLMAIVEQRHGRLVLCGDTRQLPAVEAGAPFSQLQTHGLRTGFLTEIQRQRDPVLREAVNLAARGSIGASLDRLTPRVIKIREPQARYQAIADAYARLSPQERDRTLVLAGTNEARQALNEAIRKSLHGDKGRDIQALHSIDATREQLRHTSTYAPGMTVSTHQSAGGLIRGREYTVVGADVRRSRVEVLDSRGRTTTFDPRMVEGVQISAPYVLKLNEGDWVQIGKTDSALDLRNGERYQVAGVSESHVNLKTSHGPAALERHRPLHLKHAYATTVHAAQGATTDRVLYDVDTKSTTINRSAYYVAISRSRSEVSIFTDSGARLKAAAASHTRETPASALTLANSRSAERGISHRR